MNKFLSNLYNIIQRPHPKYNRSGVDWSLIANILNTINPIIEFIVAVMVTILAIIFSLQTVMELLYIALPLFRQIIEREEDYLKSLDQNRFYIRTAAQFLGTSLRDAREAVEQNVNSGGEINTFAAYIKLKIKAAVIVAIAIYIAFNMDTFRTLTWNLVTPLLSLLINA